MLTLFPELFDTFENYSIVGRTIEKGLFSLNKVDIRDFSKDKHKRVDDYSFGGGPGMVMRPEPIYDALSNVKSEDSIVIYLSPQGKTYNQELAKSLSKEISIGDYVLTGGEIPAMVLIESIIRLLPGALSGEESYVNESHYNGLLEYPQYTRPRTFHDFNVPEILLSGDHKKIEKWRKYKSLETTYIKRPDLLEKRNLTEIEMKMLRTIEEEVRKKN